MHLFFVISGFVITMTLDRSKCASDFLVARFSRLYPAFWAAVLLSSAVLFLGASGPLGVPTASQVGFNLTMLHRFFKVASVDGVYWSLEVELFFYALALLVFTTGFMHRLHKPLLVWLLLAAFFASPIWPAYLQGKPFTGLLARLLILPYAPLFAIGVLFHRIYRGEGAWAWNYGLIAFAAAILVVNGPLPMAVLAVSVCAAFWKLVHGGLAMLTPRPLVFLGTISYSLYLVHQKIGHTVMAKLVDHRTSATIGLIVATALSVALATAITFLVERPAMKAIRDWYKKSAWRARRHAAAGGALALGNRISLIAVFWIPLLARRRTLRGPDQAV